MTDQDAWLEIGARLRPTLEKHRVLRAIVFGSFARGEVSRRSDLDLILIQETDNQFLDRYDDLLRAIAQAVPERDVDLLIYTPQELSRISTQPFIVRALREWKVTYESNKESA